MPLNRPFAAELLLAMLALAACTHSAHEAKMQSTPDENANVLWHFVHDACAPAAEHGRYPPAPCIEVSAPPGHFDRGYAVFKDRNGRYQYLVLPVAPVTGIESPALLEPGAPNYWADAWTARLYVEAALHETVPRDELSLAVNSRYGRTQNQLHVHVDCVRPDVHDALRRLLPDITDQWEPLPVPLRGHGYMAEWVDGTSLILDPFRSLAASLPPGAQMAEYGLAVVGAYSPTGRPGFILLATRSDIAKGNYGSSEELQDHTCAIALSQRRARFRNPS